MQVSIDAAGRIVVPKSVRDALGLVPGSTLDLSRYGPGITLVPGGRTARLVDEGGVRVVDGTARIDDEILFGLIDDGRR